MLVLIVLLISVCIQFISVYFALRLIKEIGGKLAWTMLSAAIFLMAVRRSISLYFALQSYPVITQSLSTEIVALVISIFILVGVIAIGPLFKRLIKSDNKLTEEMRRNHLFINTTSDAFMLTDVNGKIQEINQAFKNLFDSPDIKLLNGFSDLLSPSQHKEFSYAWKDVLENKQNRFIFQYLRKDKLISLELNAKLIEIDGESLVYSFIQDVTEREKMEGQLFKQKEQAQVTLESIADGVITTDKQGVVRLVNSAAQVLLGSEKKDVIGKKLKNILCSDCGEYDLNDKPLHKLVSTCIKQEKTLSFNNQIIVDKKWQQHHFDIIISPLRNRDKLTTGTVLVLRDVTELNQIKEELIFQSSHDPLTRLINRSGFESYLESLSKETINADHQHAVFNVCLDPTQLQLITDSCGQDAKDNLLKQASEILEDIVGIKDRVTSIEHGGFLLVIERVTVESAKEYAKKLIAIFLEEGFKWQSTSYELNVSIGIAMLSHNMPHVSEVLNHVVSASHIAKQSGKNEMHLYSEQNPDSLQQVGQKMRLNRLQTAIDEERFILFKQPIINIQDSHNDNHCEILIRMLTDDGEIISSDNFLPVAEQYQLMPVIDRWVVKEIFLMIKGLMQAASPQELSMIGVYSINLSGQTLGDNLFIDEVLVLFAETKIPYSCICFEITETAVISNFDTAKHFITTLRERGCQFSLDDFGSGLSSFGYLKELPVDFLKIDGRFILGILDDSRDYNLVKSIHQIAELMGVKTVAEFIESKEMALCVKEMGIHYGQGYALGKPEAINEAISAA